MMLTVEYALAVALSGRHVWEYLASRGRGGRADVAGVCRHARAMRPSSVSQAGSLWRARSMQARKALRACGLLRQQLLPKSAATR